MTSSMSGFGPLTPLCSWTSRHCVAPGERSAAHASAPTSGGGCLPIAAAVVRRLGKRSLRMPVTPTSMSLPPRARSGDSSRGWPPTCRSRLYLSRLLLSAFPFGEGYVARLANEPGMAARIRIMRIAGHESRSDPAESLQAGQPGSLAVQGKRGTGVRAEPAV